MKYGASLKVEFLIPGAATLAATFWLVATLGDALEWDRHLLLIRYASEPNSSSVQAILVLLILLGLAYAIGIVVVMATFYWPTNRLIQNLRVQRLETLRAVQVESLTDGDRPLVGHLHRLFNDDPWERKEQTFTQGSWWLSRKRWWHQLFASPASTRVDLHLAVSLARSKMSAASQAEYEYRRSLRQMCIGIVPAIILGLIAAEVSIWRSSTAVGSQVLLATLTLALGATTLGGLLAAVQYQESVAQWILIDIAFLEYWDGCANTESGCPRCVESTSRQNRAIRFRKLLQLLRKAFI